MKRLEKKLKYCPRCRSYKRIDRFGFHREFKLITKQGQGNKICFDCIDNLNYLERNRYYTKLDLSYYEARKIVFNYYGNECACCGESEVKFLEIDHVSNNGNAHRKLLNGTDISFWLIENNFPKNFCQLLCANCNRGKSRNYGICPHKDNSEGSILEKVVNF